MAIILLKMKESNTFSRFTLNGHVGLSLRLTHRKMRNLYDDTKLDDDAQVNII